VTAIRLAFGGLGLAAMTYAVVGAVSDDGVNLAGVVTFLAVVLLANDMVLMPLAISVGFVVVRVAPSWARAWVQIGLYVSVVLVAISLPFVIGAGITSDNPSRLPLNYGRGLAIMLVVVWSTLLVLALLARWLHARRDRPTSDEASGRGTP
jgi:hypothetical protein